MKRLHATVAVVVVAAGAALAPALFSAQNRALSVGPALLAILCLLLATIPEFTIRTGGNLEVLDMSDAALAVALICVPAPWILILAGTLYLSLDVIRRNDAVKTVFNTAAIVLSVGGAALVMALFRADGHLPHQPRNFVALLLGMSVNVLISHALIAAVVAAAQNRPVSELLVRGIRMKAVTSLLNIGLGLGLVALATYSPVTLVVVPVVGLLIYSIHRKNLREEMERENTRHLLAAGRELSVASHTVRALLEVAVPRAARLIEADTVTITVMSDPEAVGDLPLEPLRAGATPSTPLPVVTGLRATGSREGVTQLDELSDDLTAVITAVPVEADPRATQKSTILNGPDGPIGTLTMTFGTAVSLSDRQSQVIEQYVRSLETSVMRARLEERSLAEAELRAWEAGHDALTGLSNRAGLLGQSESVAAELEKGNGAALILVDLDRFKRVNDALGHESADRLLRHVAHTLAARARPHDTVARVEGDSFVVLLRRLPLTASVDRIAEEMLDRLTRPQEFDGITLSLDCTLGYAIAPEDGTDVAVLLARAEQALHQAKVTPGSVRRWRHTGGEGDASRIALTADLRRAIDEGEIVLHYQAQTDLRTNKVCAAEALARWDHPDGELRNPKDFIPVVESSSLARAFTLCVLDQAVRHAAQWHQLGLGDGNLSVSVNLSARNLLDAGLPNDVAVVLRRHNLPAHLLVLEITETVMMSELDVVETVLGQLRAQGVKLSADDFGTGYSSMSLLQRVKVNELKVDQCFVQGMLANDDDAAIIRATVSLAHSLGIEVCAEGVEGARELERLRELGCDRAQGYHLARPVSEYDLRLKLLSEVVDDGSVVPMLGRKRRAV